MPRRATAWKKAEGESGREGERARDRVGETISASVDFELRIVDFGPDLSGLVAWVLSPDP
jgi:hypothetical protein